MRTRARGETQLARVAAVLFGFSLTACAARGHIATPDEVARLKAADGMSASGRISLSGPRGHFSARVLFGMVRPDSLRIEIPAGTGLRFLLVSNHGVLRADLPEDDAMFEGPATAEVMNGLFGIDLDPKDLVGAVLGSPPRSLNVGWRFERNLPARVTIEGSNHTRLSLTLDEPELGSPPDKAFVFGPSRRRSWTLQQMAERLGLK